MCVLVRDSKRVPVFSLRISPLLMKVTKEATPKKVSWRPANDATSLQASAAYCVGWLLLITHVRFCISIPVPTQRP